MDTADNGDGLLCVRLIDWLFYVCKPIYEPEVPVSGQFIGVKVGKANSAAVP